MNVAAISQTLGLIIQLATIITLIYALSKFLHKSSDDIKEWRKEMDDWRKDVDKRFRKGNEHFDQIDEGNRITQQAILALIDHAIDQNHTEKLIKAQDDLQNYLLNK